MLTPQPTSAEVSVWLCGCVAVRGEHTHHLSAMCSVFRIIKGQGIDIKSLSSRSLLTVTNMTEDRYGNYTCVASNKLGTANATVSLIRKLSLNLLVANWSAGESECCVLWMVMGYLSSGVSSYICVFVITVFWFLFWGHSSFVVTGGNFRQGASESQMELYYLIFTHWFTIKEAEFVVVCMCVCLCVGGWLGTLY